jgi:tetratricopeptide (TPR) repeat protein
MSENLFSDEVLIEYLLGSLSDEENRRIEERFFVDDDLEDRLASLERDLIDSYVRQELEPERRQRFEERFLSGEGRTNRVLFARALDAHLSARQQPAAAPQLAAVLTPKTWRARWGELGGSPLLRVAAILVISVGIALTLWSIASKDGADVKEGSQALGMAYRDHRTSQARASGFSYAPATVVRGDEGGQDKRYDELANRLLLKAVLGHPNAESHHALGRLYFAEGRLDQAIGEFEAASRATPADAALYSDLGAAELEKARADHPRQSGDDPEPERRDLQQALQYLNQALAANPRLPEALFNRALCYEMMKAPSLARADWEAYLLVDPDSGWAQEAKQHLRLIGETQK